MDGEITSTERTLQTIVARRLKVAPEEVPLDRSLLEDIGLDSLTLMTTMLDIEDVFAPVILSDKSFEELRTLHDIAAYIDSEMTQAR